MRTSIIAAALAGAALLASLSAGSIARDGGVILTSSFYVTDDTFLEDHVYRDFIWGAVNQNTPENIASELNSDAFWQAMGKLGHQGKAAIHLVREEPVTTPASALRFMASQKVHQGLEDCILRYIYLRRAGFSDKYSIELILSTFALLKDREKKGVPPETIASIVLGDDFKEPSPELYRRAGPISEFLGETDRVFFRIDQDVTWFLLLARGRPTLPLFGVDTNQLLDQRLWERIHAVLPNFSTEPTDYRDLMAAQARISEEWNQGWITPFLSLSTPHWITSLVLRLHAD